LANCQVQAHWVWHACHTHVTLDLAHYQVQVHWDYMRVRPTLLNGGRSLLWTRHERMVLILDLVDCQVQAYWVWHACQTHTTLDLAPCQVQAHGAWHACQTHATLDLANCQVQAHWVWHACHTHVTLDLAHYQVQVHWDYMRVRPTLHWTWRTAKSKRIGCDMCVRPTPLWI